MKLKTIDLGWLGTLILLLIFFKCLDVASGWTAETPSYPVSSGAR